MAGHRARHERADEHFVATGDTHPIADWPLESVGAHLDPPQLERKKLRRGQAGLLIIDMQYLNTAEGYGVFAEPPHEPELQEVQREYFRRVDGLVTPNIRRLQDAFRRHELEVIHTRIQSMTLDGRDRSQAHKNLGLHAAPGSKDAEFLPQVAPVGDELVFNKTASGAFHSTNLAYVLRNLDIRTLYVTGVYTSECVSTTIRDASDLGFHTILVEDGCAGPNRELHNATVTTIRDRYARIMSTDEALAELDRALVKEI